MWHEVAKSGQHTIYAEGNMRLLTKGTVMEYIYHVNPKKDNKLQKIMWGLKK